MKPTKQGGERDARALASGLATKAKSRIAEHRARAVQAAYGVYEVASSKTLMVMRSVGDTHKKPVHTEDTFSAALQWVIANSPAYHPRDGAAPKSRAQAQRENRTPKPTES